MTESIKMRLVGEGSAAKDDEEQVYSFDEAMVWLMSRDLNTYFGPMAELYRPRLYAVAFRILGNHHSSEDVVQEALIKAYSALKDYTDERRLTLNQRFSGWLCKIVSNTAKNYRIRENRLVHLDLSEGGRFLEIEENRFEQPEVAIIVTEVAQEFLELIYRLPQQNRAIVLLRFMEEFDYKEMAEAMNYSSLGTLKSAVHRSVRLLRKIARDMDIQERDLKLWAEGIHRHINKE